MRICITPQSNTAAVWIALSFVLEIGTGPQFLNKFYKKTTYILASSKLNILRTMDRLHPLYVISFGTAGVCLIARLRHQQIRTDAYGIRAC